MQKKRAKDLRKDGWKTTSARSVERQLTEAELLEEVLMEDEYGTVYKQYIQLKHSLSICK